MKRPAFLVLLLTAVVLLVPAFFLTGCQFSCAVGGTTTTTAAGATTTTTAETTTTAALPTTLTTVAANTTAPASSSITQGQTTGSSAKPSTITTPKVPTITGLSPNSGGAGVQNTVVITGAHFTGVSAVMFGASHAMYHVDSDTQITATAPAQDPGTVEVVVTTAAGSSSTAGTANDYTYVAATLNTGATVPPTVTVVTGALVWKTYEDTDPHLVWAAGHWNTGEGSSYSGGTIHLTDAVGATVTVTFTGTRIALIASKAPDQGIAGAWVDGNTASLAPVDFYTPSVTDQQVVWQSPVLPYGTHQAQLWWEGEKNSSSSGTSINVDAFKILGTIQ